MTQRQVAFAAAAVVGGLLGAVVSALISRHMFEAGLYGRGVLTYGVQLVTSVLAMLGLALPVLAALATRLPGVAVGTAFVIAVLTLPAQLVVYGSTLTLRPSDLLITFLEMLSVGIVDVVLLVHRGRPLPLVPALAAVAATAALGIVLTLARYATFPGGTDMLTTVLRQPLFLLTVVVLDPVILLVAGGLGWLLGRDARDLTPSPIPPSPWVG